MTIFAGLVLLDIPGKRPLVRILARRQWIERSINSLRAHFGREPMEFATSVVISPPPEQRPT